MGDEVGAIGEKTRTISITFVDDLNENSLYINEIRVDDEDGIRLPEVLGILELAKITLLREGAK